MWSGDVSSHCDGVITWVPAMLEAGTVFGGVYSVSAPAKSQKLLIRHQLM